MLRAFSPPEKHRPRPKILQRAIEGVDCYFAKPSLLPTLNSANGSPRQQRSERREACTAILGTLLHYTDLLTLRVIIPRDDGQAHGLTMERIAELAGIGLRRAERAVRDIKAAGICGVHPIAVELEDGSYTGAAAIRTLPASLFDLLGLGKWLQHERRRAYDRIRKRQDRKPGPKARAHLDLLARSIEAKTSSALKAALGAGGRVQAPEADPRRLTAGEQHLVAAIMAGPEFLELAARYPEKGPRELLDLHREIYPQAHRPPRGPP